MPNTCKSNGESSNMSTSGARVSNAWIICLEEGDNESKDSLIPHKTTRAEAQGVKGFSL